MKTSTNFRIEEDVRKRFHIWCIQNGTTMGENIREHIYNTINHRTAVKAAGSGWITTKNKTGQRWEDTY